MASLPSYTINGLNNELAESSVEDVTMYLVADVDYNDGAGYTTHKVNIDTVAKRINTSAISIHRDNTPPDINPETTIWINNGIIRFYDVESQAWVSY
jgi:hypothetical protein